MSVAQLLADARTAHDRYRGQKPRMERQGGHVVQVAGNPQLAGDALHEALRLRTAAHVLDPQRRDPAWATEPLHDALIDFAVEQLTR